MLAITPSLCSTAGIVWWNLMSPEIQIGILLRAVMLLMSQLSDCSDTYLACQRKRFNQGFNALDFVKGELY
jgi:hypothetical protein